MIQDLLKKEEEEDEITKREIEDSWNRMPRKYIHDYDIDYIPQKEEKKKKEPERGVAIIKFYQ